METLTSLFGDVLSQNKAVPKSRNQIKYSVSNLDGEGDCREISFNHNQNADTNSTINLIPVSRIPSKYRSVFSGFPYFNVVQSTVFQDAFYTDKPLVVCAPTGSGKTVIFELGIIRLLMLISDLGQKSSRYKVVYMAPVKSLCNERFLDWKEKFEPLGVSCIQLTGDSEAEDYFELQKYTIILTTPEKWDSVTRLWKNNKNLFQMVKLLLVDEIHLLNEEERGATMEAALSRMKTIQAVIQAEAQAKANKELGLRFIAVSATFPNVEDASEWLSTSVNKGVAYKLDENLRPVHLNRVVLGYPYTGTSSDFRFDLMLSYKLGHVINTYSDGLPTLVFCATRKSVMQTAGILAKTNKFVKSASHRQCLIEFANTMQESKLRECALNGIGFHHAGLSLEDRRLVEQMFLNGQLQVLICTSTLAMGVNFPAHLVIIKSTAQYAGGCYREYTETQLLQMIGRAGRPQFDTSATAVIMTKSSLKGKYESVMNGNQVIESSLHKHIVEHLNAEIVLGTITDISIAVEWLKATFLFQRIFKNPKHYGMNMDLSKDKIERKLHDMCIKELNGLRKYKLIYMDDDSFSLQPTATGRLMAKYFITFETMKLFASLTGKENLSDLLALISSCKEFEDIQLRVNEKKLLNNLNKSKTATIRFPLSGKIKTRAMKINCLIQSTLGCLTITEPIFNQDISRIFRNGIRLTQCLAECAALDSKGFSALLKSVILAKCFKARLWENSRYVSRQLEKIGVTLSTILVNAGISSFDTLLNTHPRELELILNRKPPFGNNIIDNVRYLPRYDIEVNQMPSGKNEIVVIYVKVFLKNGEDLLEKGMDQDNHGCYVIIGDADNKTILCKKIRDYQLLQMESWTKKLDVQRPLKSNVLSIHVISDSYVGLDVTKSFTIQYKMENFNENEDKPKSMPEPSLPNPDFSHLRSCNHKCREKGLCRHLCCKEGVPVQPLKPPKKSNMDMFFSQIQNKMNAFPSKKVKFANEYNAEEVNSPNPYTSSIDQSNLMHMTENIPEPEDKIEEWDEQCLTPSLSEAWENEVNIEDIWDDVDNAEVVKPVKEINSINTLSFDVNFDSHIIKDSTLECQYANASNADVHLMKETADEDFHEQEQADEESSPEPKREVWSIEKWKDPAVHEELYKMITEHLYNCL